MANDIINDKYAAANTAIIKDLHPDAKQTFINFLHDVDKLGYAIVLTSGYRSSAKQAALKKENPKNATPGFSAHEYGIGLDLNLVKDGKWINKSSPLAEWKKTGIVDLAKNKYGMRWGGEFTGYLDPVHFDLASKYNINKMYAQAIKQFGTADKIQGTKVKLIA